MARTVCSCLMQFFGETSKHSGDSAPLSPDLAPCNFWLFPKVKSSLKGKRFQTIHEIQEIRQGSWWQFQLRLLLHFEPWKTCWENCVRSQGAHFEGDWGITVLCTMFLVSSLINVSIFHSMWLDTFWIDPHSYLLHPLLTHAVGCYIGSIHSFSTYFLNPLCTSALF